MYQCSVLIKHYINSLVVTKAVLSQNLFLHNEVSCSVTTFCVPLGHNLCIVIKKHIAGWIM